MALGNIILLTFRFGTKKLLQNSGVFTYVLIVIFTMISVGNAFAKAESQFFK